MQPCKLPRPLVWNSGGCPRVPAFRLAQRRSRGILATIDRCFQWDNAHRPWRASSRRCCRRSTNPRAPSGHAETHHAFDHHPTANGCGGRRAVSRTTTCVASDAGAIPTTEREDGRGRWMSARERERLCWHVCWYSYSRNIVSTDISRRPRVGFERLRLPYAVWPWVRPMLRPKDPVDGRRACVRCISTVTVTDVYKRANCWL